MLCDAVQGFGADGDPRRPRPGRHLGPQDPRPQGRRRPVDARTASSPRPCSTAAGRSGPALGNAVAGAVRRLRRGRDAGVERREPTRRMSTDCAKLALDTLGAGWILNGSADAALSRQPQPPPRRPRWRAADFRLRDIAFSLGSACASGLGPAKPCAARARPERPRGALVDPPRLRPLHERGGAGLRLPPHRRRGPRPAGARRHDHASASSRPTARSTSEVEAPAGHQFARPRAGRGPAARRRCEGRWPARPAT